MTAPSLKQPWYRYVPVKVRTGRGTFAESVTTPTTIFGAIRVHDNEEIIVVEGAAVVNVGDLMRLRED